MTIFKKIYDDLGLIYTLQGQPPNYLPCTISSNSTFYSSEAGQSYNVGSNGDTGKIKSITKDGKTATINFSKQYSYSVSSQTTNATSTYDTEWEGDSPSSNPGNGYWKQVSSEAVADTYIGNQGGGIKEYRNVIDGSTYNTSKGPHYHTKITFQWMEYQTYYDTYYTHLGTIDASKVRVHLTDGEIFASKLPTLIKAKTMYINLNKYLLSLEINS